MRFSSCRRVSRCWPPLDATVLRVLGICCLSLVRVDLPAADQPQWGSHHSRNMVSQEKGLPHQFDPSGNGRQVKWSVPLGTQCYSTPVVAGGRILIGTNNDELRNPRWAGDRAILLCLDETTGQLVWQLAAPKLSDAFDDWSQIGLVSTATVEGDRVYVLTNRGEVACLDLHGLTNGNDGPYRDEARYLSLPDAPLEPLDDTDADILWLYDIRNELGVHQHDAGHCSILIRDDYLYACTSNGVDATHKFIPAPDAPSLIVLNKHTGSLAATDGERIGPQIIHCTWSSPSTAVVDDRPMVFFAGGDAVCYGFSAWRKDASAREQALPGTLQRIWRFDCDPTAPKVNIHQFQDNLRVGPSHISGMPVFVNNKIYVTVGGDIWHGRPESSLMCIDATQTGDITDTGLLWEYETERHCVATPAVHEGLVYVTDCGKSVHCVDAETGQGYWSQRTGGDFWASALVADGKVYAANRRGELWVFAADKTKTVLHRTRFDAPINATPVAANGVLYIATMARLYALAQ